MIDSPCWDKETKTDCPDRAAGCAAHCDRWLEYTVERNKDYRRRAIISEAVSDIKSVEARRHRINRQSIEAKKRGK